MLPISYHQHLLICLGRSDLGVDPSSVDISETPPCSDIDDYERTISRQFAYFVRNVRNIRLITDVSIRLKKKKDWGLDQEFVAYNAAFKNWPEELPEDLQLPLPPHGGVPNMTSHFLGNMHTHYHLAVVMLHRPQLSASQSFAADSQWRHHMSVCYCSAKQLCRLQEGLLAHFDLTGLLCMQRGINFTIYAILTCIMIHLIALSSPDPEFNAEAKDYFVRHMRILEHCVSAWPMPETEAQINALRAAFSSDVNKPFELKESFPLGSPSSSDQSRLSPGSQPSFEKNQPAKIPVEIHQPQPGAYMTQRMNQISGPTPYLSTPPVSSFSGDSKPHSPMYTQSFDLDQANYANIPASTGGFYQQPTSATEIQWNPTPIIHQFDTAFAIPPSALAPPPSMYGGSVSSPTGSMQNTIQSSFTSTGAPPYGSNPPAYPQQQHYFAAQSQSFHDPNSPVAAPAPQVSPSSNPGYAAAGGMGTVLFVTPRQWQQSVANVVDPSGLKRRWGYDQHQ